MPAPVGNRNAAKGRIWEEALKRALARASGKSVDAGLDTIADHVISQAQSGEQWAVIELGNRLDGRPAQVIVGGDEDSNPIKIEKVERVVVRAHSDPTDG